MDFTLNLLKELTETPGVPGYESPIRSVVRKYLGKYGELSQDKIGSVICQARGSTDHRQDYDNAVKLLVALINKLDSSTFASLTE